MGLRRTSATLMLMAVASCEQKVESVKLEPQATAQATAQAAAPAPQRTQWPCLVSDSLRAADTLRFSSLRIHEETGDLLGTDVRLVPVQTGWQGTIALAEGSLSEYAPITAFTLDSTSGALTFEWMFAGRPAKFHGTLTCSSLVGEFRWGPGADPENDTLPREAPPASGAPAR